MSEQNETANNQIEKITIEKQEISRNQIDILGPHLNKYYKAYIDNILTTLFSTLIGKYTAHEFTTDQLANTNRTRI